MGHLTDPVTLALLVAVGIVILAVTVSSERRARRERLIRSVRALTRDLVGQHSDALVRRRATLLRTDSYGIVDETGWQREIRHFLDKVIRPALEPAEAGLLSADERLADTVRAEIDARIRLRSDEVAAGIELVSDMTPAEFERFCAAQLRALGWKALTTGATGDQGADVIAEKNGIRIVLQCKLLASAVGNKAVQQAFAAKGHFGAHHAAVVTNADFTRSARDLSGTTGVKLLHHTQLAEIDSLAEMRQD
ncbi:restriction endonuclease [uncultured Enterovirga sp.]|uniref:restriction endonuclease n=1 Tax=uncultured Enterovirga sp. TaxID=2026352 RepID=UPI0035CAF1CC